MLQFGRVPRRLRRTGLRHFALSVFVGGDRQQRQCWLLVQFLLEPRHDTVDLWLRQPDLHALLQLPLRRALGQSGAHGASELSYDCWRHFEWAVWTPLARHTGGDSFSRDVLGDATDRIDVQLEDVGYLHSRVELGIDQLGE